MWGPYKPKSKAVRNLLEPDGCINSNHNRASGSMRQEFGQRVGSENDDVECC